MGKFRIRVTSRALLRAGLCLLVAAIGLNLANLAMPASKPAPVSAYMAHASEVYAQMSPTAGALPIQLPKPSPIAVPPAAAPQWRVGFAKELTDPRPCPGNPCELNGDFHLGGFGIGPTRTSTGPSISGAGEVEHLYARAMAVSNERNETVLFASLENQGTFAAYKQGPFGLYDIRKQVSKDTGVPIGSIVINA
ncbi:MAG: hypothetical protein QOE92_1757, partial [Chloroflexota bacterium]|nr:hypothetical protein [Chloroflexota bacterium]